MLNRTLNQGSNALNLLKQESRGKNKLYSPKNPTAADQISETRTLTKLHKIILRPVCKIIKANYETFDHARDEPETETANEEEETSPESSGNKKS